MATGVVVAGLIALSTSGEARYTAPPTPEFVGASVAGAAATAGGWAATRTASVPIEIGADQVAVDVLPGEALPDDAGWSLHDVAAAGAADWDAFDAALEQRLIPADSAAGVAVMLGGQVVHVAAFGERVAGEPAESTDRFRIASISKTVTGVTALRLVAAGEVGLDEPIGHRLATAVGVIPGDPDVAGLTLRRLLNHTSGFGRFQATFFGGGASSCPEALAGALGGSLPAAAGAQYSNMNYCAAGVLIEAVTGQPYEQAVREWLLEPLGIDGMRLTATAEVGADEIDHRPSAGRTFMETLAGAGAWNATPADLVTILNSVNPDTPGPKALPVDLLAEMQPAGPGQFGLGLIGYPGGFGHTGTIQNAHSMVLAQPGGLTWAVTVSGEYPGESARLAGIVGAALAEAFPG